MSDPTTIAFDRLSARLCLAIGLACGAITWLGGAVVAAIVERFVGETVSFGADDPFAQVIWYGLFGSALLVIGRSRGLDVGRLVGPPLGPRTTLAALEPVLPLVGLSLAGMFLVYLPLSFPFPTFVESFALDQPELFPPGRPPAGAANLLLLVVLAPIVEELVFRGFLFTRWTTRYGPGAGIFGSAAAFAALHADVLGGFAFGIVQIVLYARTGSLRVPIVVHAGNNAVALVLVALGNRLPDTETVAGFRAAWWIGAIGAVVGVPWLVRFLRSSGPTRSWQPPYLANGTRRPRHDRC